MLHQPTIEKLLSMRMEPFVEAWRSFEQEEDAQQLSFDEKLSLMVDRLWTWRQNLALTRRLRYAKLRSNACVEDIDYRTARGLDRNLMRSLVIDSGWVARYEHILIIGPTGVGKSYLACALAHKACRDGYTVFYSRASTLFRDLAMARADGSLRNLLARLIRVEDVVVDEAVRGRGVGEALNQEAIRRAVGLGARTVELTSRPSREAANRLYQRLGFTRRDSNVYRYTP